MHSNFRIEVETGTSGITASAERITGVWLPNPKVLRAGSSKRPIAAQLLNTALRTTRDPKQILKFTRQYGPLTVPYRRGVPFEFSINDWLFSVAKLEQFWRSIARANRKALAANIQLNLENGDQFRFATGELVFKTDKLHAFLALEIASFPANLVNLCQNFPLAIDLHWTDFCSSPYFIAGDGREKYCSEACARIAKRRRKLKWWNDNRKGSGDGAKEAQ